MSEYLTVSKKSAIKIALSMYLGEKCKYCGKEYKALKDLDNTVWAGSHANGRLACKKCWDKNNQAS